MHEKYDSLTIFLQHSTQEVLFEICWYPIWPRDSRIATYNRFFKFVQLLLIQRISWLTGLISFDIFVNFSLSKAQASNTCDPSVIIRNRPVQSNPVILLLNPCQGISESMNSKICHSKENQRRFQCQENLHSSMKQLAVKIVGHMTGRQSPDFDNIRLLKLFHY